MNLWGLRWEKSKITVLDFNDIDMPLRTLVLISQLSPTFFLRNPKSLKYLNVNPRVRPVSALSGSPRFHTSDRGWLGTAPGSVADAPPFPVIPLRKPAHFRLVSWIIRSRIRTSRGRNSVFRCGKPSWNTGMVALTFHRSFFNDLILITKISRMSNPQYTKWWVGTSSMATLCGSRM